MHRTGVKVVLNFINFHKAEGKMNNNSGKERQISELFRHQLSSLIDNQMCI